MNNVAYSIDVSNYGCDATQASTTARNNAHVLEGVLRFFALAVCNIVEVGNGLTKLFHTRGGSIFERVKGDLYAGRARRLAHVHMLSPKVVATCVYAHRIWDGSGFRSTLAHVGPFVSGGAGEAVGHGTVGAINDTGTARMLDTGNGLFIRVDGLGQNTLGFVSGGVTEDL
jgi:hypothetical protein